MLTIKEKLTTSIKSYELDIKLSELGLELKEGEPCVLCGSLHHPKPFKMSDLKSVEKKLSQLKNFDNEIFKLSNELNSFQIEYESLLSFFDSFINDNEFISLEDYNDYVNLQIDDFNNKKDDFERFSAFTTTVPDLGAGANLMLMVSKSSSSTSILSSLLSCLMRDWT